MKINLSTPNNPSTYKCKSLDVLSKVKKVGNKNNPTSHVGILYDT